MELIRRALDAIDTVGALVSAAAPSEAIIYAADALLEIRAALDARHLDAGILIAAGRRRYRQGWDARDRAGRLPATAPLPRLQLLGSSR